MHATDFFVPSFLKAINDNTEESFRSIMSEPTPGIFTFEMLQPHFCEMFLTEVLLPQALFLSLGGKLRNYFSLYSLAFMFSYQVLIA